MSVFQKIINRIQGKPDTSLIPEEIDYQQAQAWFKNHHQVYEQLTDAVCPLIPQHGVIFDIGANIGYFSALLTKKIDFQGELLLFEPIPNLAKLCQLTFQDSAFKTQVLQYALSNANGSFDVFAARNGNIGWNTMIEEKASDDMQRISIPAKTFDKTGISLQPDLIKIDVEGAEYKVLAGMLSTMRQWDKLPIILCEVGWGNGHPEWEKELAIFKSLQEMGYGIFDLEKQPFDITTLTKTTDILFMPTDTS